jgi:hypothetical protein
MFFIILLQIRLESVRYSTVLSRRGEVFPLREILQILANLSKDLFSLQGQVRRHVDSIIRNTIDEIMLLCSFISVNAHAFICDSEIAILLFLTRSKLAK